MPEIELVPVRRVSRRTRRVVAAVGLALGSVVVGSLITVALPGGDEPAGPIRVAPWGPPSAGAPAAPGTPGTPGAPGGPSPEPADELEAVGDPATDAGALTAQAASDVLADSTATLGPADPPAPTGAPTGDPTGEPSGEPTGSPPTERAPDPDRGRHRLSGVLDPAQQLLLETVRSTAPGLAPLVGGLFATTNGVLDDIDGGLPVRQGASRR